MEIGEHDEGPEMPSPMSSSFMPSSMHETAAAATSAKMKVVLTASGGNSLTGGGGNINGVNSSNGMTTGSIANNGLTSGATHGLSHGPNQVSHHGSHMDDVRVPASMELKVRKPVKYRECLKNHAANLGSHATDGCGEFMPSGEEGTLEALICAACNCHRNFHRREVEGELPICADCRYHGRKRMDSRFPSPLPLSSPTLLTPPPHMIMAFNPVAAPDSDEFDGGLMSPQSSSLKKRFRTKFTPEQKEQMASFAQKLGWRIQKHDEEAVQQFCADIGVKRQVLKVWMHNNKLTVGKKITGCLTMTPENPEI